MIRRSEWSAHADMAYAARIARETVPRLASVRSLYVLQQERRARRERRARAVYFIIAGSILPVLFIVATQH
jgi:hypothetical protein